MALPQTCSNCGAPLSAAIRLPCQGGCTLELAASLYHRCSRPSQLPRLTQALKGGWCLRLPRPGEAPSRLPLTHADGAMAGSNADAAGACPSLTACSCSSSCCCPCPCCCCFRGRSCVHLGRQQALPRSRPCATSRQVLMNRMAQPRAMADARMIHRPDTCVNSTTSDCTPPVSESVHGVFATTMNFSIRLSSSWSCTSSFTRDSEKASTSVLGVSLGKPNAR
mmetsp:Transcript_8151/g.20358  ORF Transcript_8151/g.20358 Transcript_8151/m.20358 type:complete len:223 (-) Transcript_8151:529-1197(-)